MKDALRLIGKTPLVRLQSIERELNLKAKIFAKLEAFNPFGSIKDRAVMQMINDLERQGKLKKGTIIVEATSGNTGISMSAIAAIKGYRSVVVMSEEASEERAKIIRAYGGEVVFSPKKHAIQGAVDLALKLSSQIEGAVILGQFNNQSNPKAHFIATGKEIRFQLKEVDIFIAGIGTGGTISGVGEYLKSKGEVKVIGVLPEITRTDSGFIEGINYGVESRVFNEQVCDEIRTVSYNDAVAGARLIAKLEGLLVGLSSGAALCIALDLAKAPENAQKHIVFICPDGGDRYYSTSLFI